LSAVATCTVSWTAAGAEAGASAVDAAVTTVVAEGPVSRRAGVAGGRAGQMERVAAVAGSRLWRETSTGEDGGLR